MKSKIRFACVALLLGIVLCACTQTPAQTQDGTETMPTQKIATDLTLEADTSFICMDGMLMEYTGSDETIVLPDTVERIAADAFASADQVTQITLGRGTREIDAAAFAPLKGLKTVVVPAENPYFITADGFLVNAEKTAYYRIGAVNGGLEALENCIAALRPTGACLASFGAVTLDLDAAYAENADGELYLCISGAAIDTHSIRFDTPLQTHFANGGVSLFAVGDRVVLTYTEPFRCVENYVFDADGIHSLLYTAEIGDADYNAPILLLTGDGDTLRFVCWPKKFACGYARYDYLVGGDEILKIEGTADLADGKFRFSMDKAQSFAELNADGAIDYVYFADTGEDADALARRMARNAQTRTAASADALLAAVNAQKSSEK